MSVVSRIDERELAIELLHSVKKFFKFRELESLLGISTPMIWRYIHGEVKPSVDRAREIISKLLSREVLEMIKSRVLQVKEGGIVNVYPLAYSVEILTIASIDALLWASKFSPTCVMTTEVDGIPLATLIAKRFGIKMVVAKRRRELGYSNFYETTYMSYDPPELRSLYVPKDLLDEEDRALIVDDLVRSGRTTLALVEIARKAKAEIVGLYALLSVGDRWKQAIEGVVPSYRTLFEV